MATRTTAKSVTAEDADAGAAANTTQTPSEPREATKPDTTASDEGTGYLNVTTGPVVYNTKGQSVDAGTWVSVPSLDRIGKRARERRYILPQSEL